jgi:hypothetical protein
MTRQFPTLTAGATPAPGNVSARLAGAAVFGIVFAFAALVWIVAVAPTFVSFAVTAAIAIAWCVWLDTNPSSAGDGGSEGQVAW